MNDARENDFQPQAQPSRFSARTVLVVEDSALMRDYVLTILELEGYSVLEAENGQEALDVLREHYCELSLIILDVEMPVMDGRTFLKEMMANDLFSPIPVVVRTSNDKGKSEMELLALGAKDFVSKDANAEVFLRRVSNMVELTDASSVIKRIETDSGTGLYTRQAFMLHADDAMKVKADRQFNILVGSMDGQGVMLDSLGDASASAFLRQVADNLSSVAPEAIIGLYGDGSMAVLVERRKENDEDFVRNLTQSSSLASVCNVPVQMRWGVFSSTDEEISPEVMCRRAALALSTLRNQRNCSTAYFTLSMLEEQLRNSELENSFDHALENGQFEAWYQPKHSTVDGRIMGAEALVRWRKPDGGIMSPYLFLPLFESDGLIQRLDADVFVCVCRYQRERIDAGKTIFPITVNLSRISMLNESLPEEYGKVAASYGLGPDEVHLEITESALAKNGEVNDAAMKLVDLGFKLHLDDFGTGYSSLSLLSELPFDTVKLDKSLVDRLGTSAGDNIVRACVGLFHSLGIHTVAEGVETDEQRSFISGIGCDAIQGYLYSKPLPKNEFIKYVEAHGISESASQMTGNLRSV